MKVIYLINLFFLSININSINSKKDVECDKNKTLNQVTGVDLLDLWPYTWTVLISLKSDSKFEAFEVEGTIIYTQAGSAVDILCSGSLLKPYLVLTSASCLQKGDLTNPEDIYVYGDYDRTEEIDFLPEKKKSEPNEQKNVNDSDTICVMNNIPKKYPIRYIYYYNFMKEYNESQPDIAFIGLKKSLLFYTDQKLSVPIASPCHDINYNKCQITQVQERNRFNYLYSCHVSFEKKKPVEDKIKEQSFKKKSNTLDCTQIQKFIDTKDEYYGGNPIVCQINNGGPIEYVQIGIYNDNKFLYLPDVINL